MILEKAHQLEPVDVGHVDVGENRVEFVMGKRFERLESARGFDDLEVIRFRASFDDRRQIRAHRRGVFDDENLHGPSRPPFRHATIAVPNA